MNGRIGDRGPTEPLKLLVREGGRGLRIIAEDMCPAYIDIWRCCAGQSKQPKGCHYAAMIALCYDSRTLFR